MKILHTMHRHWHPFQALALFPFIEGKGFFISGIINSMIKNAVTRYKTSSVITGSVVPFRNNIQGRQPQLAPNVSWSIMNSS